MAGSSAVTVEPDQAAHSALGASGAHRWLNCPGSFALSRSAPARRSSSYAAAGTVAHALIERALHDPQILDRMRGSVVTQEGHEIAIDDDFIDGIEVMVNYVSQRPVNGPVWVEQTVYLDEYFAGAPAPPVRLFGRADVICFDASSQTLEIVDYKNGSGVLVDPQDNPQTLYYAAGALHLLYKEFRRQCPQPPHTIMLTIVQPHARGTEKIRSAKLDTADLILWMANVLVPGVYACARPDAPLVTGSWCRFCPASHACPELERKALEMAKRDFADHHLPDNPTALAEALNTAQLAETWIDAVREFAVEQLKAQVHIPGWGLGPTRPTRRWADAALVETVLLDHGMTNTVTHKHELRSPAQLEKVLRRQAPRAWEVLGHLIELHSSGVKLVRADNDPANDFDDNPDC